MRMEDVLHGARLAHADLGFVHERCLVLAGLHLSLIDLNNVSASMPPMSSIA